MRKGLAALGLGLTAFFVYRLWRVPPLAVGRSPQPAQDYAEALERLDRLQAADGQRVNPVCRTRLLAHGQRTSCASVLLHGFTNCPQQYVRLSAELHAAGFNVLIPRYPRHGLESLAAEIASIQAEELTALVDEAVDIAHGLGEHVSVLGLSLGGMLAARAAQRRGDIDQAILIAPAVGLRGVPQPLRRIYGGVLALLPNFFRWWDSELKEKAPGPRHAYPRVPSRGAAMLLRMGILTLEDARAAPPAARETIVVINPTDEVVDNAAVEQLVAAWRSHGCPIRTIYFPTDWKLAHDLIDPEQTAQQVDRVYPVLYDLLGLWGSGLVGKDSPQRRREGAEDTERSS